VDSCHEVAIALSPGFQPWEIALKELDGFAVRKALMQVDETYRTTLELFYVSDFSYREIGKALDLPLGTVMSRLWRGKAQLKSILSKDFYGDGSMQGMWGTDINGPVRGVSEASSLCPLTGSRTGRDRSEV
jgi:Sigma-70, region 4